MKLLNLLLKPAILLSLLSQLVFIPATLAAGIGVGGAGTTGFTCDTIDNVCTCNGTRTGSDCRGMEKNCRKDKAGKPDVDCGTEGCSCLTVRRVPLPGNKIQLQRQAPAIPATAIKIPPTYRRAPTRKFTIIERAPAKPATVIKVPATTRPAPTKKFTIIERAPANAVR